MRVAIGQTALTYGDRDANRVRITDMVTAAASRQADVVVLPECPSLGWLSTTTRSGAEEVPGPYTDELSALAKALDIAVVSGVEEATAGGIYNSAVLIDATGTMLLHHRKIDELEIGREMYERGDRLSVGQFQGTTVALDICADNWGDCLIDALALMGARVVFTPCAWAIAPGQEQVNTDWLSQRYRDLATRHGITFVAANSVGRMHHGPWAGRLLHGDSLVVGPTGVIAHGRRHQPDLIVTDVPDS